MKTKLDKIIVRALALTLVSASFVACDTEDEPSDSASDAEDIEPTAEELGLPAPTELDLAMDDPDWREPIDAPVPEGFSETRPCGDGTLAYIENEGVVHAFCTAGDGDLFVVQGVDPSKAGSYIDLSDAGNYCAYDVFLQVAPPEMEIPQAILDDRKNCTASGASADALNLAAENTERRGCPYDYCDELWDWDADNAQFRACEFGPYVSQFDYSEVSLPQTGAGTTIRDSRYNPVRNATSCRVKKTHVRVAPCDGTSRVRVWKKKWCYSGSFSKVLDVTRGEAGGGKAHNWSVYPFSGHSANRMKVQIDSNAATLQHYSIFMRD